METSVLDLETVKSIQQRVFSSISITPTEGKLSKVQITSQHVEGAFFCLRLVSDGSRFVKDRISTLKKRILEDSSVKKTEQLPYGIFKCYLRHTDTVDKSDTNFYTKLRTKRENNQAKKNRLVSSLSISSFQPKPRQQRKSLE